MQIKIKSDYDLPEYSRDGDSGFDLRVRDIDIHYSNKEYINSKFITINENSLYDFQNKEYAFSFYPNDRILIKTGISVEIPKGYELQIRSRSGLTLKHGIIVLNGIGTIDSNYRGEIGVILYNSSNEIYDIHHGEKIAQAVLCKVHQVKWNKVDVLGDSVRGSKGYGSSGK